MEPARALGYDWYAGVPCSFLTPFIDHVIRDAGLTYVSSANEGDAVAAAAGAILGGRGGAAMMQNSGLGNAVNPLTSLAWPFRFPVLLVVTWRGDPEAGDEPQHRLMGRITPRLLEEMEIPWELFPARPDDVPPALSRAAAYLAEASRPYAFLMRRGTVAPEGEGEGTGRAVDADPPGRGRREGGAAPVCTRYRQTGPPERPTRGEALRRIVELTPPEETVVIATTGHTGRELYAIADRANQLYLVGSMGCASSFGLGLAMARPDLRVVVADGDGAALMRMGNLATVGAYGGPNLVHVVLDNEMHASTGGQATVSAGVSFAGAAVACGYAAAWEGDDLAPLEEALSSDPPEGRTGPRGPRFVQLKIRPGSPEGLPRPRLSPVEVKERLAAHIGRARG